MARKILGLKPIELAIVAGGVGAVGVALYMMSRPPAASTPTASVTITDPNAAAATQAITAQNAAANAQQAALVAQTQAALNTAAAQLKAATTSATNGATTPTTG